MRFDTSISLKKRYTKTLQGFRGVDLSSSPLAVAPSHATEAYNLIYENGVNHKRHGWAEQFAVREGRVNGIFPFDERGTRVLLVHAGKNLWRVKKGEDGTYSKEQVNGTIELTDTRSQCFYRNNLAFLVGCGTYLAYGKHDGVAYSLKPVSEIAYVPTTSIFYATEYKDDADKNYGTVFEGANSLTPQRMNLVHINDVSKKFKIYLDGKASSVTLKIFPLHSSSQTITLKSETSDSVSLRDDTYDDDVQFTFEFNNAGALVVSAPDSKGVLRTAIDHIICTFNNEREDENGGYIAEGLIARINSCRFGTLFGVDGASDRLFLSGNPNEPNKDYFSEAGDFTYFPDGNVLTVGDADAPVTGYARLSDATLAVFKGEAMGSPAVFYRTGKERTMTDVDGAEMIAALFPTVAGTAGEYLKTPHAVANLSGDVLMLSENGVFGIELSSNVASTERYARERSRAIYEDLKKKDLSDAVGVSWRGRYYLAVGDAAGTCYVADARYRATFEGGADTGYEWWVWDHVPARCFAIYKGNLLFGTNDGLVCAFDDGYCDRSFTPLLSGNVSKIGKEIVFNLEIGLKKGDRVTFNEALYALVVSCTAEGGKVTFAEGDLDRLLKLVKIGDTVRIAFGEGTTDVKDCRVDDIDPGNLCIWVSAGDLNGACQVLLPLQSKECVIDEVNDAKAKLTSISGEPLPLVGDDVGLTGFYTHYSPVVATWASPVMDLGSSMHAKTLLGMSVAFDPASSGTLTFGYETRRGAWEGHARGLALLDFDRLDFEAFSFSMNKFASSYTRRMNVRNFNYIRLFYRSEGDQDCAVNGISLYYKINQMNKGVF